MKVELCDRLIVIVFFLQSSAWAAEVCYDMHSYPSVYELEQKEEELILHLGGKFLSGPSSHKDQICQMPTIKYTQEGRWSRGETITGKGFICYGYGMKDRPARGDIPPVNLFEEEAIALRPELKEAFEIEQKISAWTESGGLIWFGIGFDSGEGTSGVGGIGRYDPKTQKMEIRRPQLIRDSSIYPILNDGKYLWLGTYGRYECAGTPPTHGLVRYEWAKDHIESFEGKDDGPCGFLIMDMLLQDDYLWVATDLGLSRWDRRFRRWDHYVPDPHASPPIHKTTCEALYTDLLNHLPRDTDPGVFIGHYCQLFNTLAEFHLNIVKDFLKTKSSKEWECTGW